MGARASLKIDFLNRLHFKFLASVRFPFRSSHHADDRRPSDFSCNKRNNISYKNTITTRGFIRSTNTTRSVWISLLLGQ
jgi:hypothetical protein